MPDALTFKLVDAFARTPYSGNVAAVVMEADALTDVQMQAIAAEFNASETAFVLKATNRDAALRLRWFTPAREVDFCGHATLGAIHALMEDGRFAKPLDEPGTVLPIETRSGILSLRAERPGAGEIKNEPAAPYTLWLDMPHSEPKSSRVVLPPFLKVLGLSESDLDRRFPPFRTHDDDLMFAINALPTLLSLQPSMNDLARVSAKENLRGVFVTTTNTLSPATAAQSRFFAPAAGVDEDPVTGSAHGPLGYQLVASGLVPVHAGRADFYCAQAKGGGQAGIVRVVVTGAVDDLHVRIGGTCVTTMRGELTRLPAEA